MTSQYHLKRVASLLPLHVLIDALALVLLCSLPLQIRAADLTARVERNPIALNETTTLILETQDAISHLAPDVTPLQADFTVQHQATSTRVQVIHDQFTVSTQWQLELAPKRVGELTIPPLRIGDQMTPALSLVVTPSAPAAADREVFLEVEATPLNPYVNAQIVYRVRLGYKLDLPLREGRLSEPHAPGLAVVERLGQDTTYNTVREGQSYQVIERRYVLFAERSGALTVPAITFEAFRIEQRTPNDFQAERRRRIQKTSDALTLNVRPRPADYPDAIWLPSAGVQVTAESIGDTVRFGEPVTYTIRLMAQGLSATHLSDLNRWMVPEIPDARRYLDQPTLHTERTAEGLTGHLTQRVAWIANKVGEFEIPALQVNWWDTKNDRLQQAQLPARRITVLPAAGSTATSSAFDVPSQEASLEHKSLTKNGDSEPSAASSDFALNVSSPWWPTELWFWISSLVGIAWILTAAGWFYDRQRLLSKPADFHPEPPRLQQVRQAVQQACEANDAAAALKALRQWVILRSPNTLPTLGHIAHYLRIDIALLQDMERAAYAPTPPTWQGEALWQAIERPATATSLPQKAILPPLYPVVSITK